MEIIIKDESDQYELEKLTKWAIEEAIVQNVQSAEEFKKLVKNMTKMTWLKVKL